MVYFFYNQQPPSTMFDLNHGYNLLLAPLTLDAMKEWLSKYKRKVKFITLPDYLEQSKRFYFCVMSEFPSYIYTRLPKGISLKTDDVIIYTIGVKDSYLFPEKLFASLLDGKFRINLLKVKEVYERF